MRFYFVLIIYKMNTLIDLYYLMLLNLLGYVFYSGCHLVGFVYGTVISFD